MKLLCRKYRYAEGTEKQDKNYFSNVLPTVIETLDLNLFRERRSLSPVEYNFESVDNDGLFVEASNFSFTCKNTVRGQSTDLQTFFEFFSQTNLTQWRLEWYNDSDNLIYMGFIYKNNVKFPKRKDEKINILVVGYEKEFKDYFSSVPLGSSASFPFSYGNVSQQINLTPNRFYSGSHFFNNLFPTVQTENFNSGTHWLKDFYISELPYTYTPLNVFTGLDNFIHIKTGYDAFYHDGVSKYNFFNGMLQSMGWVWFFYLGKMFIKKRGDIALSLHTINHVSTAITHGIENVILEKQSDVIIINDGSYFDAGRNNTQQLSALSVLRNTNNLSYNLGGDRSVIFSDLYPYYNYTRPFRTMTYQMDGQIHTYRQTFFDWSFTGGHEVNNFESIFNKLSIGHTSPYQIDEFKTAYPNIKVTNINPVINSRDWSGGIDDRNARAGTNTYYGNGNFYHLQNAITDHHVLYNGNPGSCIIKYDSATNKYLNYEAYCNTEEFENNFRPLLRSETQLVFDYEAKELQTDPFISVGIEDYPFDESINSKVFSLQKLAWDWETKTTKYILSA